MSKQNLSVLFRVRAERVKKNGMYPINVRITVGGQRVEFSSQLTVAPSEWDSETGRAVGETKSARIINDHLDLIRGRIREAFIKMEQYQEPLTAHGLRDRYLGVEANSRTILQVFDEHNQKCEGLKNKGFAPATIQRYCTTRKHFAEFIRESYQRPDLNLGELTPKVIGDFDYFLKTKHNCSHNTATKYLKNFKKITRIAIANGWLKSDPFITTKFHLDDVDMAYLTEEELQRIMTLHLSNQRLQRVRDIYVFCCFTGLAFTDTKELLYSNIEEREDGKWIITRRHKTKQLCRIPMMSPALTIMEKFKSDPYCIKTGRVLPVPSNQKTNAYLQEIADLAGINKHLSTHTARHTFATTVTLSNKISIEVVAKMLGHSSINMTKKYARVVDDFISRDMSKIQDKYKL